MAYEAGVRIYVSGLEELESLLDTGVASGDDWEDGVDYFLGYSRNYSDENGFYIYPNLSALEGGSNDSE